MPRSDDAPGPDELRSRIETLYKEMTLEDDAEGALAWFARRAYVLPKTVGRWCRGERTPSGPAVALLEHLEDRAGIEPGA